MKTFQGLTATTTHQVEAGLLQEASTFLNYKHSHQLSNLGHLSLFLFLPQDILSTLWQIFHLLLIESEEVLLNEQQISPAWGDFCICCPDRPGTCRMRLCQKRPRRRRLPRGPCLGSFDCSEREGILQEEGHPATLASPWRWWCPPSPWSLPPSFCLWPPYLPAFPLCSLPLFYNPTW